MNVVNFWILFICLGIVLQRQLNDEKRTVIPTLHLWTCFWSLLVIVLDWFLSGSIWSQLGHQGFNLTLLSVWWIALAMIYTKFVHKQFRTTFLTYHWFLGFQCFNFAVLVAKYYTFDALSYGIGGISFLSFIFLIRCAVAVYHYLQNTDYQSKEVRYLLYKLPFGAMCFLGMMFQASPWSQWWVDPLIFACYAKLITGSTALEEEARATVARKRNSQQLVKIDLDQLSQYSRGLPKKQTKNYDCILMVKHITPLNRPLIENLKQQNEVDIYDSMPLSNPPSPSSPLESRCSRETSFVEVDSRYAQQPALETVPEGQEIEESLETSEGHNILETSVVTPKSTMFVFPHPIQRITSRLHAVFNTLFLILTQLLSNSRFFWYLWGYLVFHFCTSVLLGPSFNLQSIVIKYLQPFIAIWDHTILTAGPPRRFGDSLHLLLICLFGSLLFFEVSSSSIVLYVLLFIDSLDAVYNMCLSCLLFFYAMQWKVIRASDQTAFEFISE
jgi:hypothetical protein